ncbi:complement regulator-acquiring protein [Borreliella valaisiana]|uniref:complement regulator-acquiring protein n=1 Tax=Borreliella valaisiana TaxID=62088 RepID=UPI002ED408E2|nr:complement regulator-acquiring protein [Borreliella valaisiana]
MKLKYIEIFFNLNCYNKENILKKNNLIIIIYFLSFSSCNSANSALENKDFEFNRSGKIIEANLKLDENHLKSEAVQDDLIVKIIEIAKRIKAKIILDRAKIEPLDQFGMKDFVFNNLIVDSNREKYSHNENKDIRRKFYSSLNYNEKLIRVFGKILNKISSNTDNQNLDLLIVKAGQYYSQYELEYSAEKINEQMDKLMGLNIGELSLILSKLKELMTFKTRWIDIINQIVSYCENNINLNDIKDDLGKMIGCIEYINSKYEYFFKYEILKTEILSSEITKILDK